MQDLSHSDLRVIERRSLQCRGLGRGGFITWLGALAYLQVLRSYSRAQGMLPVWGAISCQHLCYISGEEPWAAGGGTAQPASQLQTGNAVSLQIKGSRVHKTHAVWLEWNCKVAPSNSHQSAFECLPQHSHQVLLRPALDRTFIFQGRPFYLWTVLAGETVRLTLDLSASLTLANTWEVILCNHKEYVTACSKWQMFECLNTCLICYQADQTSKN